MTEFANLNSALTLLDAAISLVIDDERADEYQKGSCDLLVCVYNILLHIEKGAPMFPECIDIARSFFTAEESE